MKAVNLSTAIELADNLLVAATLMRRMKGLLGREPLQSGQGLWIKPCKGVHTFGMKFPIDVAFLDRHHNIIAVKEALVPNRMTKIYGRVASVLELPAGTLKATLTKRGDRISIS